MMDRQMIVNPDHMSQAAVDDTLTLLESRHYSGVISPHGWMDPGNWPRLWKLGGMAFPGHSQATDYVKDWQKYRPKRTPYFFGWGYGADLGGLADQPAPSTQGSIGYPFKSYDGSVTFDRQRTGDRTFDYSKEGVAQYGLYADWFADLRRVGGQALAQDMWNGSEAYLEMWERAEGIRAPGCNRARVGVSSQGLAGLRLGSDWQTLLRTAGQPQQRTRTWTWCANGAPNRTAADVAVLNGAGTVDLVGSTARGRSASGFAVGARAARVVRRTRSLGAGVHVRSAGRVTWVYAVRRGRIRAVGVATRRLARSRTALRRAVRLMLSARATQTQPEFVPSAAQAATRTAPTGQTLAGSSSPRLNTALAVLCHLQVT
jgi:hypothetical protein